MTDTKTRKNVFYVMLRISWFCLAISQGKIIMVQFGLSCLEQEGQCARFWNRLRVFFRKLGLFMNKFDAVEYFLAPFSPEETKAGRPTLTVVQG